MIKSAVKSVFKKIRPPKKKEANSQATFEFETDAVLGIRKRKYYTYQQYLDHQRSKLSTVGEPIRQHDQLYETIVKQRYAQIEDFRGKRVICLGARLGGEVRAFKSLGALAVGIDIEPGPHNPDVLYGDFHHILFPDGSFDVAFTNGIDHVFAFDKFVKEVHRILTPGGKFYVELGLVKIGNYEVLDTQDPQPIVNELIRKFQFISQYPIRNTTNYTDWEGLLICLEKSRESIQTK